MNTAENIHIRYIQVYGVTVAVAEYYDATRKVYIKSSGIAKCSPEDKQNASIGRLIAASRAVDNLSKKLTNTAWSRVENAARVHSNTGAPTNNIASSTIVSNSSFHPENGDISDLFSRASDIVKSSNNS